MRPFTRLIEAIAAEGAGALVSLVKVEGSSPREAGARMVVRPSGGFHGTIGGGELEWQALAAAADALAAGRGPARRAVKSLGPDLGQCCGGRVEWLIETFDARDRAELEALAEAERAGAFMTVASKAEDGRLLRIVAADSGKVVAFTRASAKQARAARPGDRALLKRAVGGTLSFAPAHAGAVDRRGEGGRRQAPPGAGRRAVDLLPDGGLIETFAPANTCLYLFGAGHVGRALVLALAPLPFDVRWIDSRPEAFPARAPHNVTMVHSANPANELAGAPDGAQVLVMTHSHPLDLDIVARALGVERFAFVGLIGSATKRARFLSQMRAASLSEAALAKLVCPIGLPGVEGKEPAVIAASVAAQLLGARGGG